MQTQTYKKEDNISSSKDLELVDSRLLQLAQDLQMPKLSEAAVRLDALATAGLLYDELKGKDFQTWKSFLPTRIDIHSYSYDIPPVEALQAIHDATAMRLFETIEIWVPTGNKASDQVIDILEMAAKKTKSKANTVSSFFANSLDPMAVGVIYDPASEQRRYFPIVRWGEALFPVETIRKINFLTAAKVRLFQASLVLLVCLAVAVLTARVHADGAGFASLELAAFIAAAFGLANFLSWRAKKVE